MSLLLVELYKSRKTARLPARVLIGRRSMNHLVIDSPAVSRMHAWIDRVGGGFVLTDMNSRTGTRVNGAKLRGSRALVDCDVIDIGPARLTFYQGDLAPLGSEPFEIPRQPTLSDRDIGIRFDCPHCRAPMWAAPQFAGNVGTCAYCGEEFAIPRTPILDKIRSEQDLDDILSRPAIVPRPGLQKEPPAGPNAAANSVAAKSGPIQPPVAVEQQVRRVTPDAGTLAAAEGMTRVSASGIKPTSTPKPATLPSAEVAVEPAAIAPSVTLTKTKTPAPRKPVSTATPTTPAPVKAPPPTTPAVKSVATPAASSPSIVLMPASASPTPTVIPLSIPIPPAAVVSPISTPAKPAAQKPDSKPQPTPKSDPQPKAIRPATPASAAIPPDASSANGHSSPPVLQTPVTSPQAVPSRIAPSAPAARPAPVTQVVPAKAKTGVTTAPTPPTPPVITQTPAAIPAVATPVAKRQAEPVLREVAPFAPAPATIAPDPPPAVTTQSPASVPRPQLRCGVCQSAILASEVMTRCPSCGLAFHEECWQENFGCSAYGCDQANILQPPEPEPDADNPAPTIEESEDVPPVEAQGLPWPFILLGISALSALASTVTFGATSLVALATVARYFFKSRKNPNHQAAPLLASMALSLVGMGVGAAVSYILFFYGKRS